MIRLFRREDLSSILSLYGELNQTLADIDSFRMQKGAPEATWLLAWADSRQGSLYVFEEAQCVKGFVLLSKQEAPHLPNFKPLKYGLLMDLVVGKPYRHQKIGTELIQTAKKWVQHNHLAYLELNVLAENKIAQSLYLEQGFVASELRMIYR